MPVLLVDDDPDQLAVREMLFQHAGFSVLKAGNVYDALRLARENRPACAVVDLCLPREEDGLALIRSLKDLHSSLSILVLTGKSTHRLQSKPEWKLITAVMTKGSPAAYLLAKAKAIEQETS